MIRFEVIDTIKTKGRPRVAMFGGYPHIYTPKDTQDYENLIKNEFLALYPNIYTEGALKCKIRCLFKPNKEIQKQYVKTNKYPYCVKHKDIDNVAKVVLDALNGVLYKDDKQIIELNITKEYNEIEELVIEFDLL